MLTALGIKNYALIEDISLDLTERFSIITGETGAGKSIILGALSLLLGKRADLNAEKKCVIEGHFLIADYGLKMLFEDNDLDYEDETIIRREILPSGKSRAFVNDTPVKLSNLSTVGNHLIDIHSQHETLSVGSTNYQYQILDIVAQNAG
ncbi:MAG: AAA family ATPase, partial [Psychroflexus sp.]